MRNACDHVTLPSAMARLQAVRLSLVPITKPIFKRGENHMTNSRTFAALGFVLALCAFASPAGAQSVTRLPSTSATPIVPAVVVPPGYTTYYISGTPAGPMNPSIPDGQPGRWGDTSQQTSDSLNKLEAVLKQLGLTFGDVVKATVFLAADPANGGKINFPAMNAEWSKRFGSATQPNKPARSTIQVGLATPGALVEIEMIAVKKN
jgi:enamine deaminase RidA (YjgF/YER057c/UK114 family)